jgi:hypothetical protein
MANPNSSFVLDQQNAVYIFYVVFIVNSHYYCTIFLSRDTVEIVNYPLTYSHIKI